MQVVFKFSEQDKISLGRLARGDSFTTNFFGNTHNKLISRKELGDLPFRPHVMFLTFDTVSAEETNTFLKKAKEYIGKEVILEFPSRNRKYSGGISKISYAALQEDAKGDTIYSLSVDFIAATREKIDIKLRDSPDDNV